MSATPDGSSSERRFEMSEDGIERMLRTATHGVLSLAADGEAYAVPMSFGYDGEGLYFVFRRPAVGSRKVEFVEATERATFVVSSVNTKHDWASVLVEGPLRPVEPGEWNSLLDALGDDAWFPSVFSETDPREDFLGFYLAAERKTGRRGADHDTGE
jgi:nitroimidazol reductase NimA-like FMN-containing flavoprotein (pyridoxamine 5'-phosphate oxidase superfamily)